LNIISYIKEIKKRSLYNGVTYPYTGFFYNMFFEFLFEKS